MTAAAIAHIRRALTDRERFMRELRSLAANELGCPEQLGTKAVHKLEARLYDDDDPPRTVPELLEPITAVNATRRRRRSFIGAKSKSWRLVATWLELYGHKDLITDARPRCQHCGALLKGAPRGS